VLLLDEPFSALDMPVRLELRRELRRLQRETGLATVLVTHDPEEAAFLSDELIVLADGAVLQSGVSRSVFSQPASAQVARLLGAENMNVGTVRTSSTIEVGGGLVRVPDTEIEVGTAVWWSIAPERVRLSRVNDDGPRGDDDALRGTVVDVADMGSTYDIFVKIVDGVEVLARTTGALEVEVGSRCRIDSERSAISLWAAASDRTGPTVNVDATR
jgi:molybdate transport system permease protein